MLEINNTTRQKINRRQLTDIVEKFLRTHKKKSGEVSLAIIGPARMKRLNEDYRGIAKTTDVLSFPNDGSLPSKFLGEIIINIEETKKVAKYREMFAEISLDHRGANYILDFLLVHGLLHLLGYDDETEKDRLEMLRLGRDFLKRI